MNNHLLPSALLLLALPALASAHAFLDHASPTVGATIATSPKQVKIWFTDDTQPARSAIQVFDAGNHEVDNKDTHADPKNDSLLIVSLPPLPPGTYHVRWHALCPDSHKTQGRFQFTINPAKPHHK